MPSVHPNRILNNASMLTGVLLVTACAGKDQLVMPDNFSTETLVDGSKRFSFSVNSARRNADGITARDISQGRAAQGAPAPRAEDMEQALKGYFEIYPYCEEGYFIYDQGFDGNTYTLLGECQESATEEVIQ